VGACASVQTRLSALTRVAELPEGSGVAASRRTPGRFWSHNDSGDPVLFALDGDGRVIGRLRIAGAVVEGLGSAGGALVPVGLVEREHPRLVGEEPGAAELMSPSEVLGKRLAHRVSLRRSRPAQRLTVLGIDRPPRSGLSAESGTLGCTVRIL